MNADSEFNIALTVGRLIFERETLIDALRNCLNSHLKIDGHDPDSCAGCSQARRVLREIGDSPR